MPNNNMFDLDIQVSKSTSAEPRITSYALCTPGTCAKTCKGNATLNSNCCITKTCITCA